MRSISGFSAMLWAISISFSKVSPYSLMRLLITFSIIEPIPPSATLAISLIMPYQMTPPGLITGSSPTEYFAARSDVYCCIHS